MARSYVRIVTQIGKETTPGTAVAATKTLAGAMIDFSPELDVKRYRAAGKRLTTTSVLNKNWVAGKYDGVLSYNELPVFLDGLLGEASPASVGTGGYGRTYSLLDVQTATAKTYTLRRGDTTAAQVATQGQFKSFTMQSDRNEVKMNGTLVGQAIDNAGSLTSSIPQMTESPVSGNEVSIYVDSTSGALGTTALGCPFNFKINIPDLFSEKWCLNRANTSFADTPEIAVEPTISFDIEFSSQARALYDAVVLSSLPVRFIRFDALGANIGTGADYKIQWDFAAKIRSCKEVPDVDGVYAYTFEWDVVFNSAWAKAMNVYVVNATATI